MSSSTPYGPEPEFLEAAATPVPRRRGGPVLVGAAVGVLGTMALGAWAAFAFLSGGGDQPAEAVPHNAAGYLSLDLDPSAGQKIEAFEIMRKFPALADELGLESTDDLRRMFFEEAVESSDMCSDIDYDRDVAPWIGDRIALAVVPSDKADGKPAPMAALQVNDAGAALAGLEKLFDCSAVEEGYGYAVSGDYVVLTESFPRAEEIAEDATELSLADNDAFQDWTAAVGDPGILTVYAAPSAPQVMLDLQEEMLGGSWAFGGPLGMMGPTAAGDVVMGTGVDESPMTARMREMYRDFQGLGAVLRFSDGAVEFEMATQGMPTGLTPEASSAEGTPIGRLPATTAGALAIAFPDNWLTDYLETLGTYFGEEQSVEEMLAEAEAATGLSLPEDVETLLGDGLAVAVDASIDPETLNGFDDLDTLPVGVLVDGDPEQILPLVDKVRAAMGADGEALVVDSGDGLVGYGLNADYLGTLVGGGSLGSEPVFQRVVPEADRVSGALFVNFDAGDGWLERLAELDGDSEAAANLRPLEAVGLSSWMDGEVQRGLFRLTTED